MCGNVNMNSGALGGQKRMSDPRAGVIDSGDPYMVLRTELCYSAETACF